MLVQILRILGSDQFRYTQRNFLEKVANQFCLNHNLAQVAILTIRLLVRFLPQANFLPSRDLILNYRKQIFLGARLLLQYRLQVHSVFEKHYSPEKFRESIDEQVLV